MLHHYANLYFNARNPMLYAVINRLGVEVCVLKVSTLVLNLSGVVLTDQNAASNYVRFLGIHQWPVIVWDDVFATHWNVDDPLRKEQLKKRKCAEALVPHRVPPQYIEAISVRNVANRDTLAGAGCGLPIRVDAPLFFD